jgi:hypothetical protein
MVWATLLQFSCRTPAFVKRFAGRCVIRRLQGCAPAASPPWFPGVAVCHPAWASHGPRCRRSDSCQTNPPVGPGRWEAILRNEAKPGGRRQPRRPCQTEPNPCQRETPGISAKQSQIICNLFVYSRLEIVMGAVVRGRGARSPRPIRGLPTKAGMASRSLLAKAGVVRDVPPEAVRERGCPYGPVGAALTGSQTEAPKLCETEPNRRER